MTFKTNKAEKGGYYILRNVQKVKNEPDFFDIWLLTDSVKDPEKAKMLASLHELGQQGMNYWTRHLIYPYTHKFVLYSDIVDCLTGVVRMIEFRCFNQSGVSADTDLSLGSPDPTIEGA